MFVALKTNKDEPPYEDEDEIGIVEDENALVD